MAEHTTGAPKGLSLQQLSNWLWGQETAIGPVIAIGNTGAGTAATFRFSLTEPETQATIKPKAAGQAIAPAGKSLVCEGRVFVSGQLTDVAVFR
jgi:hypothetical protein